MFIENSIVVRRSAKRAAEREALNASGDPHCPPGINGIG
jgi:hypothetical protein